MLVLIYALGAAGYEEVAAILTQKEIGPLCFPSAPL